MQTHSAPNKKFVQVLAGLAVCGVAYISSSAYSSVFQKSSEITGKVQTLILNPEGDVDGFLLSKGPQVHFPPHMSSQLLAVVGVNDEVKLNGVEESAKVFKAEKITNLATKKSVTETPPQPGLDRPLPPPPEGGPELAAGPFKNPPPPPPHGHGPGPGPRESLAQLKAESKISTQLFGRKSEVNGVILADGTIVRFGPRLAEDTKAKLDIGQNLKVTGFGTKNKLGEAIEATELSN